MEGSTRLLEELGGERYAEALLDHRGAVRDAFGRHGGVEVDTQGDAFFVAFGSADEALAAAGDAQSALAGGPVRVRMGLHTGEPVVTAEGYVGMDVHRGARIAAAGHGGQVVVSDATRVALRNGAELRDLGEQRLKDLGAPIRLWQLGDGEFPPLKVLYRSTLPVQPSPLVGRERELAEAAALLAATRLLTLTGPGGSGKTRLALQLAADAADEFPDGVFWVPLAPLTDPKLVIPTVAEAVGAAEGLAEHIGAKRMLLLLDNFEHVVDAAPAVAEALAACPHLRALATSRAPLRIAGEQEFPVDPLPDDDAVELFIERARGVSPAFEPGPAVREICVRLDDLPLAIELAAARMRVFDADTLLARLDQRLPLLTGGSRDAPERQRTLRATIEWSYDLLGADEQRHFSRLAVFPGSFDLAAAEEICGVDADALESLIEQSLVRRWASGRFGMLETIRELAVERLDGQHDAVAAAHLDYFLARAEAATRVSDAPELLALDADRDNFRAAMRWGLDHGRPVDALRVASGLGRFWAIRAHREGYAWLSEGLEAAPDAPDEVRAAGLIWAGSALFFTGDVERSEALFTEALELARKMGDDVMMAEVLDRLAGTALARGRFDEALALAEESVARYRGLADRRATKSYPQNEVAYPLHKIAHIELQRGSVERAIEVTEEALAIAQDAGDAFLAAGLLDTLAELYGAEGETERAGELAREALRLSHQVGNAPNVMYVLARLADDAATAGDTRRAGILWGAAEAMEERGEAVFDPAERERVANRLLAAPDAAFDAGRTEGRAMSLDDVVARALAG